MGIDAAMGTRTGEGGEPDDMVRVRRISERARYDAEAIHAVFDATVLGHVGVVRDGRAAVIPMFVARDGDDLLLHGAPAAGILRAGKEPTEICVEATVLDGLVLARSAFHHSMNYRSAVAYGIATEVTDADAKLAALELFAERLIPGRGPELRQITPKEVQGTSVLRMTIEAASEKHRDGQPVDDDEDYELDIWAGVVPITATVGAPVPDPRLAPGTAFPESIQRAIEDPSISW